MSQTASTIPPSGIGKLHFNDFWKSLFLAALANMLLALYPIIDAGHWPTAADLNVMLKSTVAIVISYLAKNLLTNNVGQILAKDKPVTTVSTEKLEEVVEKAQENK